jgi:hypothetical protein
VSQIRPFPLLDSVPQEVFRISCDVASAAVIFPGARGQFPLGGYVCSQSIADNLGFTPVLYIGQ